MRIEAVTRHGKEKIPLPTTEELLNLLEANGILYSVESGTRHVKVADLTQLKEALRRIYGEGAGRSDEDTERVVRQLCTIFAEPILSKEQIDAGDMHPKPLFYIPRSVDSATSVISVKTSDFHMLVNEALLKTRLRVSQPTITPAQGSVSLLEACVAVAIFHPRYGDGFRDEAGVLYVRDKETRKYERFSGSFLESWGFHKNYFLSSESTHGSRAGDRSLREGFVEELPHLVAKGILHPNRDIRQHTIGSEAIEERRFEHIGVTSSGAKMIAGVQHYIGKDLHKKQPPVRITALSRKIGCVIDDSQGFPKIIRLFNIVSREEAVLQKNGSGSMYAAGATLTQPRDFSAAALGINLLPGETKAAFEERCESVDRGLAYLLLVSAREHPEVSLAVRTGSPLFLAELGKAAYWLESENHKSEFDSFVHSFGYQGLRSFLATAYDSRAAEYIFAIAEKYESSIAQAIFKKFTEFVDVAEATESMLRGMVGQENAARVQERIQQQLLNKGVSMLKRLGERPQEFTEEALARELAVLRAEAVQMATAKRAFEKEGMGGSETVGITFSTMPASALQHNVRAHAQIEALLHRSYKDDPARAHTYPLGFKNAIREGAQRLSAKSDTTLWLATRNGAPDSPTVEVLGCLRFDAVRDKSGAVQSFYFGSFAADQAYAGGGFGEELMRKAFSWLDTQYPHVVVEAHCDPRAPITQKYLGLGFVADRVGLYADVPSFSIVRDRTMREERLGTAQRSAEEILARAGSEVGVREEGVVRYIISPNPITAEEFARYLNKEGKVAEPATPTGVVLTHYFTHTDGAQTRYYAVLEALPGVAV